MYNSFVTFGAWKESPKAHNSLTLPYTLKHTCMHTHACICACTHDLKRRNYFLYSMLRLKEQTFMKLLEETWMKAQQMHNYTKGLLYRIACKENMGLVTTGMKAYCLPYGTMIVSTE